MDQPKQHFRLGFTGSRKGMTDDQESALRQELRDLLDEHGTEALEAHHGDAIGADTQFHTICQELNIPVVIHPSKDQKDRAFCEGAKAERPPQKFRQQSESIVNSSDVLIAAPDGFHERFRGSGTWMTVRIARKAARRIILFFLDGTPQTEVPE
jgi:hypothetical protein